MKLSRDLNIAQKNAWHLAHRIRETFNDHELDFAGKVEVDETYVGGLEKDKHWDKKLNAGRGGVGKSIVAGMKNRETNNVKAQVVPNSHRTTLHDFIESNVAEGSEEFAGRHNTRPLDFDQMRSIVRGGGMVGKRLKFKELVSGVDGRFY